MLRLRVQSDVNLFPPRQEAVFLGGGQTGADEVFVNLDKLQMQFVEIKHPGRYLSPPEALARLQAVGASNQAVAVPNQPAVVGAAGALMES